MTVLSSCFFSSTTRCNAQRGFFAWALFAFTCVTSISKATSGDCNDESGFSSNRTAFRDFEVNTANVTNVTNGAFTASTVVQAIVLGSAVWNEQGNAGGFKFVGTTGSTDITDCTNQPSLVRLVDGCCNLGDETCTGFAEARCSGSKFRITVFKQGEDTGVCQNR